MNKKISLIFVLIAVCTFGAEAATTYQQLNFKQLNPRRFSVYSKPAPKGWREVVIKDKHKHKPATPTAAEQQQSFMVYQRPATEPIYPKSFPAFEMNYVDAMMLPNYDASLFLKTMNPH